MTPDEWAIEAAKRRDAQRPKTATKRSGKTPETTQRSICPLCDMRRIKGCTACFWWQERGCCL